jgi:hypothetical protein
MAQRRKDFFSLRPGTRRIETIASLRHCVKELFACWEGPR